MATAASIDSLAIFLGGSAGNNAALVGAAVKPWFFAAIILFLISFLCLIIIIMVARRTNGFRELRASMSGKRICWFFDDARTAEMKILAPSAGIVDDEELGSYVIHEEGSYVDKKTRNVIMCFNTPLAMGASVKHFEATDKLSKILGDQKKLQNISLAMANGEFVDESFASLKSNVNFSSLKSFSNAILPTNIMAKINLEVAKRVKSYGQVNTKQLMWFVIIGIGLILLAGLVFYMVAGGQGGSVTNVYSPIAGNFSSNSLIG